jgi:hypothetical protein
MTGAEIQAFDELGGEGGDDELGVDVGVGVGDGDMVLEYDVVFKGIVDV